MHVRNQQSRDANGGATRKWLPRGAGEVFSDASLADRTLVVEVDQGDDVVLRLWLPGGIEVTNELPWIVRMNVELDHEGHVVVSNLQLERKPGGPGVTAAALREVLIGELLDEVLSRQGADKVARLVRRGDGHPDQWAPVDGEIPPALLVEAKRRTQTQRGRQADEGEVRAKLTKVAEIARAAPPGGVLSALKGDLHYSPAVAKKMLRAARDAGLLEHSSRSRRGPPLTTKGRR
jgi:hypothetical protein